MPVLALTKVTIILAAILMVSFFSLIAFCSRLMSGSARRSFLDYLLIGGMVVSTLSLFEMLDLFAVRRHIPLEGQYFWPFLAASIQKGAIAALFLGSGAWLCEQLAAGAVNVFNRQKASPKKEGGILRLILEIFPVVITLAFLIFLTAAYFKRQWWIENPLPFCLIIPLAITVLSSCFFSYKKHTGFNQALFYVLIWTSSIGYFVFSQIMERFHNTDLRCGVILLLMIAMTASLHLFLKPSPMIRNSIRWGILFVWFSAAGMSAFAKTPNSLVLNTFLRSNYLYFLTLGFDHPEKLDFIQRGLPSRSHAVIQVKEGEKPDILLVTSEALRADFFQQTKSGIESVEMPEVSKIAGRSTFFARHYSVSPVTLSSFYSILTGKYHPKASSSADPYSFFEIAKKAGYRTEVIQPFAKIQKFPGMADSIDAMHSVSLTQKQLLGFNSSSELVTQKAKEVLTQLEKEEKPYLLWIHYVDPHAVYNDPSDPEGSRRALTKDKAKAKYLAEVKNVDMNFGRLMHFIESSLQKKPKVVFTADHGEEFLEHLNRTHGTYLYDESLRVPFFIFDSKQPEFRIADQVTGHVDIFPTLTDWMGVQLNNYPFSGISLAPFAEGGIPPTRDSLVLISDKRNFVGFLEDDKKLIYYYFHLKFFAAELFDLKKDPAEKMNLYDANPETAAMLGEKLQRWMKG